jgi:hypothetical protein
MLYRRIPRTTVVAVDPPSASPAPYSAPTAATPILANALGIRFAGFAEISSWSPHMSPEPATRQEIDLLARRAGLSLTDEHLDELVQAYGYVEQMLMRLRRARSYADEPAHVFVPTKFLPSEA